MTECLIKFPGPEHPITIEPNTGRVTVVLGGRVIADTREALTLREAAYPPVQYSAENVDMAALTRSDHTTYCSYKGVAAYFSIPAGGGRSPMRSGPTRRLDALAEIRDHLASTPTMSTPSNNGIAVCAGARRQVRPKAAFNCSDVRR